MLNSKQKKCIEMMASGDFSQKEIASAIDVAEETISRWKKDDEFMRAHDREIGKILRSLSAKAARRMEKLLDAKSDMTKFYAAKDILDRSGFKPAEKMALEDWSNLRITIDYGEDGAQDNEK